MPRKKITVKTHSEPEKEAVIPKIQKHHMPYTYAVGRRKTAIARVRLQDNGKGEIIVNQLDYKKYFPYFEFQQNVVSPLQSVGLNEKVSISVRVNGGGKKSQSEAVRHGISRALTIFRPEFRKTLKPLAFLTRDPREKERKKPGLKRARRAPQWQKR